MYLTQDWWWRRFVYVCGGGMWGMGVYCVVIIIIHSEYRVPKSISVSEWLLPTLMTFEIKLFNLSHGPITTGPHNCLQVRDLTVKTRSKASVLTAVIKKISAFMRAARLDGYCIKFCRCFHWGFHHPDGSINRPLTKQAGVRVLSS